MCVRKVNGTNSSSRLWEKYVTSFIGTWLRIYSFVFSVFVFCLIFVKNQLDSFSLVDKDHFIPLMSEWMNPLTLFGFFLLSVKGQICLVCSIEFNLMGQTVVKRPQIFHLFFFIPIHVSCRLISCLLDGYSLHPKSILLQPFLCLLLFNYTLCLHVMYAYVFSCLPVSVRFPLWAGKWFARVRDAVPLLHRPALRPSAALHPPHSAAVHPQRDQHSEIHQVRCHIWECMYA